MAGINAGPALNDVAGFKAGLGTQLFGPDPHKGDDASFRLWDSAYADVRFGDFEVMTLGPITKLPPS